MKHCSRPMAVTIFFSLAFASWNFLTAVRHETRGLTRNHSIYEDESATMAIAQISHAMAEAAVPDSVDTTESVEEIVSAPNLAPASYETIFVDILIPLSIPSPPALQKVKEFTSFRYEKFLVSPAGKELYALLYYLTSNYGDERPVVDVGTRFAASALALAAGGPSVYTFDLPHSRERKDAFRGSSELVWKEKVKQQGIDIRFFNVNLLEMTDLRPFLSRTWLILLDTYHRPYSHPFERQLFERIFQIKYKGILLVNDIDLNDEMKRWWEELLSKQKAHNFHAYNITHIGHAFGTGLVDFSGKVKVEYPEELSL